MAELAVLTKRLDFQLEQVQDFTPTPMTVSTAKGPSDEKGMSRYEFEKEITLDEAQELMKLCEPGSIDKVRYLVKSGSHTFEVDEFHGENEGLVMAEVELQSEEESYEKPDFIGQEVTGDRRYYNAYLTKCPFTSWPENRSADR